MNVGILAICKDHVEPYLQWPRPLARVKGLGFQEVLAQAGSRPLRTPSLQEHLTTIANFSHAT